MSLLQSLSYKDYQRALAFNTEQCEAVAKLADLRNISFENSKQPGQNLIKTLDRQGITLDQYKAFVINIQKRKQIIYQPNSKVAIIIGNDRYVNMSKLVTPPTDCILLSNNLKNLGFNVIILRNTTSRPLKDVLRKIFSVVPEGSYCVIFYAGHGGNSNNRVTCMLSVDCPSSNIQSEHCITENDVLDAVAMCVIFYAGHGGNSNNRVTCMLSVDCPSSNIQSEHCITENDVLDAVATCKPDLCLFIMDMCRINLDGLNYPEPDKTQNTQLDIKNLIICYSSQEFEAAYEAVQLYCSTIDSNMTYELKTEDLDIVVPDGSQYVNAFCRTISEDIDVGLLMDKVHSDVANSVKFQRPTKIQRIIDVKRSLHDPAIGDTKALLNKLKTIGNEFYEALL